MQNDEEEIRQLVATWMAATKNGDVKTVLELMSDDVVFLVAGQPPMIGKSGFAETAKTQASHDRFLLEYDSPRAGTFEPLRFVPKGKTVVLGLVSTKVAELEKVDDLRQRIERASKYIPLEQLAISPQCGFASDVVGNLISEDDQKRKLEVVVETARQVWGTS